MQAAAWSGTAAAFPGAPSGSAATSSPRFGNPRGKTAVRHFTAPDPCCGDRSFDAQVNQLKYRAAGSHWQHQPMCTSIRRRRQILLFMLVGGGAAAVNFGSRFIFSAFVDFNVAIVLAFFTGITTAFALNRAFVFVGERATSWRTEAVRFAIVNLFGLTLTLGISLLVMHHLLPVMTRTRVAEAIAHCAGIAATVASSYLAHRFWTFRG
jgi:putative flippase GtrA